MFEQFGSSIFIAKERGQKLAQIPAGTYNLEIDMFGNHYLERVDNLDVPAITYGDTVSKAQRVVDTYLSRQGKNTGLLLQGDKGSGKTLQAKFISAKLREEYGIPTIMINAPFHDSNFVAFMAKIKQPAMVMFDEFDKVYSDKTHQEQILTLLDGTGGYNKMFVLTKNAGYISEFFQNRPSRIFYTFNYEKIGLATLQDFLEVNLKEKRFTEDFMRMWDLAWTLSFDVVQSIVEELNRYPTISFREAVETMGITMGEDRSRPLKITKAVFNGVDLTNKAYYSNASELTVSRLLRGHTFNIHFSSMDEALKGIKAWDEDEEDPTASFNFEEDKVQILSGSHFVFQSNEEGNSYEIVIQEEKKDTSLFRAW